MRILVTTAMDAANLSVENIVKEMIRRGHDVEIFAQAMDPKTLRMFKELDIPIHSDKELTEKTVAKFDVAFSTIDAMKKLTFADIYVFSYNNITDTWVTEGSDFMFTMVRDRKLRCNEDCAFMPIGDTKNDVPLFCDHPQKQILYIDAGHNPWGIKGKRQIAEMLLKICEEFKDYQLVVKPRWLIEDTENQTHRSTLHIYNVLKEVSGNHLPPNLILLNEHKNLQLLVDESECTITTSISCYIDVALRGKGCIVVDGLDAEEQFETRPSFRNIYKDARQSGCCINYQEVIKYLPAGLICNSQHLDDRIPYKNDVSNKILNVVEHIYEHYIKNGMYPSIKEYDYDTYKEVIESDSKIYSLEQLKYKRLKNAVLNQTRIFELINADIDYSSFYKKLDEEYNKYHLNPSGLRNLMQKMELEKRRIFINNKSKMMNDSIDQSFLLLALYDSGQEQDIIDIPLENVLCRGPYNYYLGLIYSKHNLTHWAMNCFYQYLNEANERSFCKYTQESDWAIRIAYDYILNNYDGTNLDPENFASLYFVLYEQRNMTVANYGSRKRAHHFLPSVAEQLENADPQQAYKCLQLYAKWEYHYNIRERNNQINTFRSSKFFRLKQAIKRLVKKAKGGIRCLQEHGWSYTWHHALDKTKQFIKKKIGNNSFYQIWNAFHNIVMKGYQPYTALIRQYGDSSYLQILPNSNGDVYTVFQYYLQYVDKNFNDYTNVAVSSCTGFEQIADWFSVKEINKLTNEQWLCLIRFYVFVNSVHINILHHHMFIRHTGILTYLEGIHGIKYFELLKAIFFQDIVALSPPLLGTDDEMIDLFTSKGLQIGKTVLLSPYAQSLKSIPEMYWALLVEELHKLGLSVCTDAFGSQPPILNTVKVEIPFNKMGRFLNLAGYMVSRRSGIDDITRSAICKRAEVFVEQNLVRSQIINIVENFSLSANPIIVNIENIQDSVKATLLQLGLTEK